jgi:triacylglycerol lipase
MPFQANPNPFDNFQSATTRWNPNNSLALARASDLAYQDDTTVIQTAAAWGFKVPGIVTAPRDIQAIVLGNAQAIIVAFRGTISEKNGVIELDNWMADANANQISVEATFGIRGHVHEGFANAFSGLWQGVQDAVKSLQTGTQSLWITGHSLGGALAVMAAAAFTFEKRLPFNGLYTYGQPRVGDPDFCGNCETHFGEQYFRFVNDEDIVTRVPPRFFPHFPLPDTYGHAGRLLFFDAQGQLHNDEHWWNNFLTGVEVGFKNFVGMLTVAPINDHNLDNGYIAHIQQYLNGNCQPPMQW